MEEIKIEKEFLEELLEDEIELCNLAYNRNNKKLADWYQKNIDKIEILLKLHDHLKTKGESKWDTVLLVR